MQNEKKYNNSLGIKGWFFGGRWGFERYIYFIHRITGIGLVLYFLLHIILTTFRVFGESSWNKAMNLVSHPIFKIGEFLVFIGFCFHALNGIRLILLELGFIIGKPIEPVYPYKTSILRQRPLLIIMMLLAGLLIMLGAYDFFILKK